MFLGNVNKYCLESLTDNDTAFSSYEFKEFTASRGYTCDFGMPMRRWATALPSGVIAVLNGLEQRCGDLFRRPSTGTTWLQKITYNRWLHPLTWSTLIWSGWPSTNLTVPGSKISFGRTVGVKQPNYRCASEFQEVQHVTEVISLLPDGFNGVPSHIKNQWPRTNVPPTNKIDCDGYCIFVPRLHYPRKTGRISVVSTVPPKL